MQQTTALIILNYNNTHDTRNCIESIQRYNTARVKYIVVDNNSTVYEQQQLREVMGKLFGDYLYIDSDNCDITELPYATLLQTNANLGYANGNNRGLLLAERDDTITNVMILNNDILFVQDIIPPLTELLATLPDCAIVSPVLYKQGLTEIDINCARLNATVSQLIADNLLHYVRRLSRAKDSKVSKKRFVLHDKNDLSGTVPIELPSGSCMLIRKSIFREIGFFDPGTFLYFEENILYQKIRSIGLTNYISLDHKCIHLGASTTGKTSASKWLVKVSKESEMYYVRKFSGASQLQRALHRLSVRFFMATFTLQKRLQRLRAYPTRNVNAGAVDF